MNSLQDYFNAEESHLAANRARLGNYLHYVDRISDLWLGSVDIGDGRLESVTSIASTLSIAIHERMLAFVSHYMRSHLQDAFTSLRQGIDCALTLLALILDDRTLTRYLERKNEFRKVKNHIKDILKSNHSFTEFQVKLIDNLISIHELTSELAAHADINTVVFRRIATSTSDDNEMYEYRYFQWDEDDKSYKFFYIGSLLRFLLMLQIIAMRKDCEIGVTPAWQTRASQLGNELEDLFRELTPNQSIQSNQ